MSEQTFAHMCEVPVRVSRGRYPLIHLEDMDGRPGNPQSASPRNISHGVWPPLTAMMKKPRAATASHASSAMIDAALRATDVRICEHFDVH